MAERKLSTRTTGLYKKANTLFNLLGTRIAVIVQPSSGMTQGYVSHEDHEWPELHRAMSSIGVHQYNLLRPDNFDTVADRHSRQSHSFSSNTLTAPPSVGGPTAPDHDETDRQMMEILASVLEQDGDSSAATDNQLASQTTSTSDISPTQKDHRIPSLQRSDTYQVRSPPPWLPSVQQPSGSRSPLQGASGSGLCTGGGIAQSAAESRKPISMNGDPASRRWHQTEVPGCRRSKAPLDANNTKRRRKSTVGHDEKRRRIVTRSQDDDPFSER